jgi:hypothetical protein
MAYILKLNGSVITSLGSWQPEIFGKITRTSYPSEVKQSYVWEHDGYWLGWVDDPKPVSPTADQIRTQINSQNKQLRADAYRINSDPLFFKAQRGEATMQEWTDKVNEIKALYPSI